MTKNSMMLYAMLYATVKIKLSRRNTRVFLAVTHLIRKNADLEDRRELGFGNYGTVFYGKWRGTNIAIKRIKKSCFFGRSLEQERLIRDFWREGQIISKLHHPNVVAFYGVVPDGVGGALETVTEFIVKGSVRHVLMKKDRSITLVHPDSYPI